MTNSKNSDIKKRTNSGSAEQKSGIPTWVWFLVVIIVAVAGYWVIQLTNQRGTVVESSPLEITEEVANSSPLEITEEVANSSPLEVTAEVANSLPLEISAKEAALLDPDEWFILDVREQSEWDGGHIEGATLIPLGQLEARQTELPTDQKIVVVCQSGGRSAKGRDLLLEAGFTEVTSMAGGMNDWVSLDLPVVTGP